MQTATQSVAPFPSAIGRDIALEMAHALLDLGEGATRDDLKKHKRFTDAQIDRHGEDARVIADKLFTRRIR
jgi:hypothetical protein